jgi:dTDP-4-amino-4,6-dideoxygalactose transaminase
MNKPDIEKIVIQNTLTLKKSLELLEKYALSTLLLVDVDGILERAVTDGDIRRLLLSGASLDDTLEGLPKKNPYVLKSPSTALEALKMMNKYAINLIPIVDKYGRPVDFFLRKDIDFPIQLSIPHLGSFERKYVEEAFETNWIAPLGPNVDAFEKELADYVGINHASALSSGTAAIHLALRLLDVKAGDKVFCSSLTFIASANPILYQGATPVFIDSEPESWNMSPSALSRAFIEAGKEGGLPKAVIVVNIYGQSADYDEIIKICGAYNVPVVEDAAESLGATYKNQHSGTLGDLGIYSFNGNKIITTSGGGMLISNKKDLIDRSRFLSTQAREPASYYEHNEVGYNYRMSNVLAGIGRGQLQVLENRVDSRRAVFDAYKKGLENFSSTIKWMPEAPYGKSTRWLTACELVTTISPDMVIKELAKNNIEARRIWKPMHLQPLFENNAYYTHAENYDFSKKVFDTGICLPSGSSMTKEQQEFIIDRLSHIFNNA